MENKNRERNRRIEIKLTIDEYNFIQNKMKIAGTENLSKYARKMLMNGVIVKTDFSILRELVSAIGRIGNNINQIAFNANRTKSVNEDDLKTVINNQKEIRSILYNQVNKILNQTKEKSFKQ